MSKSSIAKPILFWTYTKSLRKDCQTCRSIWTVYVDVLLAYPILYRKKYLSMKWKSRHANYVRIKIIAAQCNCLYRLMIS